MSTAPCPALDKEEHCDVVAAAVILGDYFAVQRAQYSERLRKYGFHLDLTEVFTPDKQVALREDRKKRILSKLLSGTAMVIMRHFTGYAKQVLSADAKKLGEHGIHVLRPYIDYDALLRKIDNATFSKKLSLADAVVKMCNTLDFKENWYKYSKAVAVALHQAAECVARHDCTGPATS